MNNSSTIINKLKIKKEFYDKYNIPFKNKKYYEIDFVYKNNLIFDIFEVKNGCNFDTKKSNGEVEILKNTKELFENEGFICRSINIVCYDAKCISDIIIKTDITDIKLLTFEDMCKIIGIDSKECRLFIDENKKKETEENMKYVENVFKDVFKI